MEKEKTSGCLERIIDKCYDAGRIVKDHKLEELISRINNLFPYEVRKHGSRKEIERVVLKWVEEEGIRRKSDVDNK